MTCDYKGCMRDGALQMFYDTEGNDMGEMIICEYHVKQIFAKEDQSSKEEQNG